MAIVNYRNPSEQRRYRNQLLTIYDNKCPITGDTENIEAAHIVSWRDCNIYNSVLCYCPYNGIIMAKRLHRTEFEQYKFTFDYPNYKIIDDSNIEIGLCIIQDNLNLQIFKYRYKKIIMPQLSLYFIRDHYIQFNNINYNDIQDIYTFPDYLSEVHVVTNKEIRDKDDDIIMLPLHV